MAVVAPSPSRWRRARPTNCRWRRGCWTACLTSRDGWSATAALPPTPSATGSGTSAPDRHPAQAHRRAGRLPALDLRQPALGREPLGATERVAGDRNPLRKNRQVLPRRPLLRRHLRLAQGLTGLSVGSSMCTLVDRIDG